MKWKWRKDRRSERNLCNCVNKPKKNQDFNGVWTRDLAIPVRCSTNWAKKPLTHFFHGNIWTHNWPAPNVSGFIAQLVEHHTGITRSWVQTPLKSWIFFQASLRNCINCVHCDDHFFISFPQFIYDLFHISLTFISFTGTYEPTIDLLPTSVTS